MLLKTIPCTEEIVHSAGTPKTYVSELDTNTTVHCHG